jgi:hypothetical protein
VLVIGTVWGGGFGGVWGGLFQVWLRFSGCGDSVSVVSLRCRELK